MTADISQQLAGLIAQAYYAWFTTVRADGMPQPTPVWFVYDGSAFLIYSMPDAQKVRNIRHSPKVALSFSPDDHGEAFFVVMGTAEIDPDAPPVHQHPAYLAKYAEGIARLGMTPESMAQAYSTAIRVTATHIREQ